MQLAVAGIEVAGPPWIPFAEEHPLWDGQLALIVAVSR